MRGIHTLDEFDLVLNVIQHKHRYDDVAVARVTAIERRLDDLNRRTDALADARNVLLAEAAIEEERLIAACRAAQRKETV